MPDLPVVTVNQTQYDYLVDLFTRLATAAGLPGPAEAYVQMVNDTLVQAVRADAYAKLDKDAKAAYDAKKAEVDAMLADLISGANNVTPV